jgi:hypothetical protein
MRNRAIPGDIYLCQPLWVCKRDPCCPGSMPARVDPKDQVARCLIIVEFFIESLTGFTCLSTFGIRVHDADPFGQLAVEAQFLVVGNYFIGPNWHTQIYVVKKAKTMGELSISITNKNLILLFTY